MKDRHSSGGLPVEEIAESGILTTLVVHVVCAVLLLTSLLCMQINNMRVGACCTVETSLYHRPLRTWEALQWEGTPGPLDHLQW